jgi:hypothetical protein
MKRYTMTVLAEVRAFLVALRLPHDEWTFKHIL